MIGIVSGLERSGTSMMMQMLEAGGIPVAYDGSRPADEHNPRGYYELEGGKIIRSLMESRFDPREYDGRFVKVTAYGLTFLPTANYQVIYMCRNLDEVLDSQAKIREVDRDRDYYLLNKLNKACLALVQRRFDMRSIIIWYNDVLDNPAKEIDKLNGFLQGKLDIDEAIQAVDRNLHRNVRNSDAVIA